MPSTNEIVEQAESLRIEDRLLVVDSLLRTLNPPDAKVDRKWVEVATRRLAELRSKRVTPLWRRGSGAGAQALSSMTFSFHPEADKEFENALQYYETCERGLGEEFYLEVHATIDRILRFPRTWPVLAGEVRRCLVHRFPYGVLYSAEPDGVFILAVIHLRRADIPRSERSRGIDA